MFRAFAVPLLQSKTSFLPMIPEYPKEQHNKAKLLWLLIWYILVLFEIILLLSPVSRLYTSTRVMLSWRQNRYFFSTITPHYVDREVVLGQCSPLPQEQHAPDRGCLCSQDLEMKQGCRWPPTQSRYLASSPTALFLYVRNKEMFIRWIKKIMNWINSKFTDIIIRNLYTV